MEVLLYEGPQTLSIENDCWLGYDKQTSQSESFGVPEAVCAAVERVGKEKSSIDIYFVYFFR
jgi:hypothetical protein